MIKSAINSKLFLLLYLTVCFSPLSLAEQNRVGKWDLFELSFKNERIYANPFQDVSLIGEFTHEESKKLYKVNGFYDGGLLWKIRFMPDREGKWRYKIYFSDAKDKPYEGSFLCLPSKIKGPLTVYQNNKIWFAYADGTPFYMFAFEATDVDVLADLGILEQTLDFLQKQGFNTIVGPHIGLSEIPGIGYRAPWVYTGKEFDFSRYDLRFWKNMDKVLFSLKKRGMFLVPFSIFGGTNDVPKMPQKEWENFIRYWTARWSGFYNATFQPFSEWEEGFSPKEVLQILSLLKANDPWKRLASVHSWDYSKKATEICRANAYDYFTLQDKLTDWNYWKYKNVMDEIRKVVEKPILAQECIWEGNFYQEEAGLDVENMRRASWTIILSGAYLTYGDEVTPPRKIGREGVHFTSWGMLLKPTGQLYPYLKFMFQIITSLPWWKMRPFEDIEGNKHPICLASQDKSVFLVYLPEGGEVKLIGVSGHFDITFLDPVKFVKEKEMKFSVREGALSLTCDKEKVLIVKKAK
ncbi:DUF5060 domain-containing protein [bacterium]|nr:DUF5060 domain-containing protein [bacterium]